MDITHERTIAQLIIAFSPEGSVLDHVGIAMYRDTRLTEAEESVANQAFLEVEGDLSARRVLAKVR